MTKQKVQIVEIKGNFIDSDDRRVYEGMGYDVKHGI